MTETVLETAPIATFSAIPEQNIRFSIDMARLRDAWRAVSGLGDDGSFTLVVSSREVRLQASDQLSVEGIVPISEISGFNIGTALHLNLAENSLAALGFGELPRSGYVILDNLIAEEGFLGVMKLETDFVAIHSNGHWHRRDHCGADRRHSCRPQNNAFGNQRN
jgi:hypothetical protein